jgi:nucleoside-diphosphate-sugar epimerase
MRVFVTGAAGFIGSAIVQELIGAGHTVLGLARSDAEARSIAAAGAEAHPGALEDPDSLRRGVAASEGVIHTAYNHDFVTVTREAAAEADRRAIEVLGAELAGSGRPFVVTSGLGLGLGLLAHRRTFTEDDALDPSTGAAHRLPSERAALSLASRDVRASVVRLPPSVHGDGDRAFVPELVRIARETGVSAYVGDGRNRWPAVHRLDAARLYRLALEKGAAGATFHGVAEEGVPTRDIAEVIGRRLNVPVVSQSPERAASHFTWLARLFAFDVPTSSTRTQQSLDWHPQQLGLISDLERGRYFEV